MLAAGGMFVTVTGWPGILVAATIAGLNLTAAFQVLGMRAGSFSMSKPPPPEHEIEDDPRRRLGLKMDSGDEDPALTRRKVIKDRLAIAGAILALIFLMFMMFSDAIENYQCSPWEFVSFKCNRFDAKFKPWDQDAPQPEK